MSGPRNPREYRDSYADQLNELIEARMNLTEFQPAAPAPATTNKTDLTQALQASPDAAKKPRANTAAPESTCREMAALADEVVCATTPSPFFAVGASYWDFTQTTHEEVRDLLRAAPGPRPPAGSPAGSDRGRCDPR
jgi:hypothetical protein